MVACYIKISISFNEGNYNLNDLENLTPMHDDRS